MKPTKPKSAAAGAGHLPESPFRLERLLRAAQRNPDGPSFTSDIEFAEFLGEGGEKALVKAHRALLAADPQAKAQDLAFQAYEEGDAKRALKLARAALELDPACTDALAVQAFVTCDDTAALIGALEEAVTGAGSLLGDDFFATSEGDYWALVPARPYLRTARQLAEVLWDAGYRFDSVHWYESLLELDPGDHSGNAPLLIGDYLAMGEVQRTWDLLDEHNDDSSAVCAWSWVLLHLLADDAAAAHQALERALELNPYAAPWFLGLGDDEDPSTTPFVAAGGEDEARLCVQILGEAWQRAPEAQVWLEDVLLKLGLLDEDEDDDGGLPPPPPRVLN